MITKLENKYEKINIPFEELSPNTNFTLFIRKLMNSMKESSDVNEVIEAIHNLDKLLEYDEKLFIHTFDNVYDELKKFLFNENPDLVKASLYLLSDVLSISWIVEQVKDWAAFLIPQLIRLKISSDSLDEECQFLSSKCLESIPKFCIYEETALILLNAMTNKHSDYTDVACDIFRQFMLNAEKSFIVDAYEWNEIFENIFMMFPLGNKKRIIAENIIHFFRNEIFTNEEWEEILAKLDDHLLQDLIIIVKFDYSSVYNKKKKFQALLQGYGGKN